MSERIILRYNEFKFLIENIESQKKKNKILITDDIENNFNIFDSKNKNKETRLSDCQKKSIISYLGVIVDDGII